MGKTHFDLGKLTEFITTQNQSRVMPSKTNLKINFPSSSTSSSQPCREMGVEGYSHTLFLSLAEESFPCTSMGSFHRRQISMNFSSVSSSHRQQLSGTAAVWVPQGRAVPEWVLHNVTSPMGLWILRSSILSWLQLYLCNIFFFLCSYPRDSATVTAGCRLQVHLRAGWHWLCRTWGKVLTTFF